MPLRNSIGLKLLLYLLTTFLSAQQFATLFHFKKSRFFTA